MREVHIGSVSFNGEPYCTLPRPVTSSPCLPEFYPLADVQVFTVVVAVVCSLLGSHLCFVAERVLMKLHECKVVCINVQLGVTFCSWSR